MLHSRREKDDASLHEFCFSFLELEFITSATIATMTQRVVIGTDHAGYALKEVLKKHLMDKGIDVIDEGTFSEDSVDYPEYGKKVAAVMLTEKIPGVFLGGSGLGECIAGNKIPGIRAARCTCVGDAVMTRRHNDANMLNMGGRMIDHKEATKVLDAFLETAFDGDPDSGEDGERHIRRLKQVHELDGHPYS
jgi:ribose 5-phosphate isomerase B